jgi:hypothetical protein
LVGRVCAAGHLRHLRRRYDREGLEREGRARSFTGIGVMSVAST